MRKIYDMGSTISTLIKKKQQTNKKNPNRDTKAFLTSGLGFWNSFKLICAQFPTDLETILLT